MEREERGVIHILPKKRIIIFQAIGNKNAPSSSIPPKVVTGLSNFRKLVLGSDVFVDQNLLIKDFIERDVRTLLMIS